MKYLKIFVLSTFVFMFCSAFTLKNDKKNGMYMVGVSASFTDSLIYFTDVQFVEGVKLGKDKLLPLRAEYSSQMEHHLLQKEGLDDRTCFIYFSKKKERLQKAVDKMKKKYQKTGKSILKQTDESFKFSIPEVY